MRAIRKFRQFHQRNPREVFKFAGSFAIPEVCVAAGTATRVLYSSDKLNPTTGEDEGWVDYFHDHDPGVTLYRCDGRADGPTKTVPAWLRECEALTWLGYCLGLSYDDHDGNGCEVTATNPLPELFCAPNGRALVVVQGRRNVVCMMWGGRLGVEPRGIVH